MIEVLWHGRGGQGAFTAARLLGAASSFADGSYALAFPSFGPERRGAPMRAFTKMSREPIGDRSAVNRANYVIYLDDTLLGEGWEDELLPDGKVVVNSVRSFGDPRIVAIDANGISQEILADSQHGASRCAVLGVRLRERRRREASHRGLYAREAAREEQTRSRCGA